MFATQLSFISCSNSLLPLLVSTGYYLLRTPIQSGFCAHRYYLTMVTRVIPGEVVVIKAAHKNYILVEKNFLYKTKIEFPELTFYICFIYVLQVLVLLHMKLIQKIIYNNILIVNFI